MSSGGEHEFDVTTADGLTLHATLARPERPPRGAFLLCHGITTNCDEHGQFPALRDHALRAGLAVARFDFRAHGRSEGTNADIRLAGMRADADAVAASVSERLGPELPIVVLGVSFAGSAAVALAATRPNCAGLVLWYPVLDYARNFAPDSAIPFTRQMWAARTPEDPEWAELPLVGTGYYIPRGLMAEMPDDPTLQSLAELRVPALAYYGGRDKLVDAAPARTLAARGANLEAHVLPGAGHGFILWRRWVVSRTVRWAVRAVETFRAPGATP